MSTLVVNNNCCYLLDYLTIQHQQPGSDLPQLPRALLNRFILARVTVTQTTQKGVWRTMTDVPAVKSKWCHISSRNTKHNGGLAIPSRWQSSGWSSHTTRELQSIHAQIAYWPPATDKYCIATCITLLPRLSCPPWLPAVAASSGNGTAHCNMAMGALVVFGFCDLDLWPWKAKAHMKWTCQHMQKCQEWFSSYHGHSYTQTNGQDNKTKSPMASRLSHSPQRQGAALISVPRPWASSEPTLQPSG